jgi:hypothetical protein
METKARKGRFIMPRAFSHSTAELVVQIVDAVHFKGKAEVAFIEKFCDLSTEQVINALGLAKDLGLVKKSGSKWCESNILSSFFSSPIETQKAAALRIVLEKYPLFVTYRERLVATNSADDAAQETKTFLDLDAHREEIKDTLISLGTYTGAITIQGGGRYTSTSEPLPNKLRDLANACEDQVAAETRIRHQIGIRVNLVDREEVLVPLSQALLKAKSNSPSDAVKDAAVAFESFLARLAEKMGVNLAGTNGINQKLEKFRVGEKLPKKIVESGKYLGQIRNAADHGVDIDPEVSAVWRIQDDTGLLYVYVTCQLIAACLEKDASNGFIL